MMSNENQVPKHDSKKSIVYQIKIRGNVGKGWSDWFEGMNVTSGENGDTLLTGPLEDQAALHGVLKKVRDLGIILVSVNPVEAGSTDEVKPNEVK